VNGGTDIVLETRKGELGCAGAAADRLGRLVDDNGPALLRQGDGSCQSVWSCADDYSVVLGTLHRQFWL
jgi:hypothetical protein